MIIEIIDNIAMIFTFSVIGRRWNKVFKEWNLYTYCGGNPIAYVDLSAIKKKSVKIPKGYKKDTISFIWGII